VPADHEHDDDHDREHLDQLDVDHEHVRDGDDDAARLRRRVPRVTRRLAAGPDARGRC
jgi:hypothetical protein